jgi:hypothetical protein
MAKIKRFRITKRCYFERGLRMEGSTIDRPADWKGHKYAQYIADVAPSGELVSGKPPEGYDPETGQVYPGYDPLRPGTFEEQMKEAGVAVPKAKAEAKADAKEDGK